MRLAVRGLADPEVFGTDRLDDLRRQADQDDAPPPPLIFAPNHHSHLDTALMVRAVPFTWRKRLVVAAAADYFFDKRWKATLAALSLNAIPIDRESTGRRSADMIRELVDDGWSLVIYPEGGRSPDGWGQTFKGGAAYLAGRTGAPVVPVFIDGTGSIFGKGMKRPKPGRTRVVFGAPMQAGRGREHAPLQRAHRGRRRRPRRRGDDRLLVGPPAGRGRHQPGPRRPRAHRLAPAVGPLEASPARHRRLASPAGPPLARSGLSGAVLSFEIGPIGPISNDRSGFSRPRSS